MKRPIIYFVISILLALIVLPSYMALAQEEKTVEEKNILVLHSYHQGLEWSDKISEGIQSVFKNRSDINLIFEYLDTKRHFSTEYFDALKDIYSEKAKKNPYSVIITCDNAAFDFMRAHSQEYYPGVPVVYCGVNNLDIDLLKENPNFFGFDEKVNYKHTIKSIQKIFPERKNVLMITDSTITGMAIRHEMEQVVSEFEDDLNFEFFSKFDMPELAAKVKSLDDSYVVYLSVLNRDKNGKFISYRKGISTIKTANDIPVFGSWDFYTDKGLFGGKITRGFDQGEHAASLAETIIDDGVSKHLSQLNNVINKYVFDYNELEKYDISVNQLPENSLVINLPDEKDDLLKFVLILSLVLLLVIIFLSVRLFLKKQRSQVLEKLVNEKTVQLQDTNAALKEIIVKKDRFLSIMSHDLKGPFNSMLGFSELLNNEYDKIPEEKQRAYIEIIYEGMEHTYKLLENILSWSYSQSGNIEFNPQKEDVSLLTKEIVEVLNFSADQKSIKIVNHISDSLLVSADKNMLSTIIRNLVFNAIKFTPRDGTIELSAKMVECNEQRNFVEFSVKDNGVGMTAEIQSKLFDIGEMASTNGTDNETGTGLGLILCKEFTDKHKGRIWAESEVGKGSTFLFTIPAFE